MGCKLFVGKPLDSCKSRCYKNRAERAKTYHLPCVYFPCVIPLLCAFLDLSEYLIADRVYILLFSFFF